jgi:hypothetical protein
VRVQPRIDTLDVVQVQAHRQQPNRLTGLEHAEAHHLLAGHVVLHRRRVVRERQQARRRAGALRRPAVFFPNSAAAAARLLLNVVVPVPGCCLPRRARGEGCRGIVVATTGAVPLAEAAHEREDEQEGTYRDADACDDGLLIVLE